MTRYAKYNCLLRSFQPIWTILYSPTAPFPQVQKGVKHTKNMVKPPNLDCICGAVSCQHHRGNLSLEHLGQNFPVLIFECLVTFRWVFHRQQEKTPINWGHHFLGGTPKTHFFFGWIEMWKAKTRILDLEIDKSNHESIQWEHILVHKSVSEKDPRSTVCSYCNISIWAWTCPSCCHRTIGSVMTNWNPSWPIETVFIRLIFYQRVLCPAHHAIGIWKIHTSSCYPTY